MEIQFENDLKDTEAAFRHFIFRTNLAKRLTFVASVSLLIAMIFSNSWHSGRIYLIFTSTAIVLLGLIFLRPYYRILTKFKKAAKNHAVTHWVRTIITADENFTIVSNGQSKLLEWTTIEGTDINEKYILIVVGETGAYFIPVNLFPSRGDATMFYSIFKSHALKNNQRK